MKKTLKRHGQPEAITTDGLRSYRAAMDELGNRSPDLWGQAIEEHESEVILGEPIAVGHAR